MLSYGKEIDGLRAIAVLFVILFHAGFSSFKGGYIGVDVFFVISGYLITSIIWHETTNGTFSLKDFYERRIRRIAPVLFFVLFITIIPAWLFLWPSDLKDFSKSLISVVFFISNIFFLYNSGYFNTESELSPLIHTWSLSLEEQYYIIFPLIILYIYNKGYKHVLRFLLCLSFISLAACIIIPFYSQDAGFFLLPFRAWQLLLGALVAIRTPHNNIRPHIQNIMSLIGLTLIVLSALLFNNKIPYPSFYALAPTIGTCLIIIFCTPNTFVGKVLSRKIFVSIGLVSYSAYLWHQPIFAFLRYEEMITPGSIEAFGVIIAVFILSFISWHYIEKPFRNKKAVSRKHVYIYTLLASIVIIISGALGIIMSKQRMDEQNQFMNKDGLSFRQIIEKNTEYDMYKNMYTDKE